MKETPLLLLLRFIGTNGHSSNCYAYVRNTGAWLNQTPINSRVVAGGGGVGSIQVISTIPIGIVPLTPHKQKLQLERVSLDTEELNHPSLSNWLFNYRRNFKLAAI